MTPDELNRFLNGHDSGAKGRPDAHNWPRMHTTPPVRMPVGFITDRTHRAAPQRRALLDTLDELAAQPPCASDPEAWTGDQLDDQQVEAACHRCTTCPVLDECRAYAETLKPSCGIWAGRRYGKKVPSKGKKVPSKKAA
ncbi:WhiB family transcriptional regulator [Acidipropionibacterium jensenii]|uniref:WhiB family transcriptional regulator n=1 Tax=Acidipropionibacterium jensenii TaxID=1749 RepID=UPI001586BC14|nr:WhiB family transcriptional regulator [Acidipropionibacterium jensenii]